MLKPLLSICIPTYNREKALKRLLDGIVHQRGFTHEVEIVIDDGPSTDHTKELVGKYQKKYPNIRYFRNKAIGMQPALLEAISLSNGIYTRLFGSDDLMYHDSLEITLNIIKKLSPTLILYKGAVIDNIEKYETMSPESKVSYDIFKGFSAFGDYLAQDNQKDRFDKTNFFSSICISCFRTGYYNEMLEFTKKNICNFNELKWHYFNFIFILYSNLSTNDAICVIDSPRMVFGVLSNTASRAPNPKIAKDSKMMMNYIKNKYPLSKGCVKLLNKISFGWRLSCKIIGPIRKTFPFISKLLNHPFGQKLGWKVYYKLTNLFK